MQRISRELNLPEPVKARILLEMAADLEALYQLYRDRGYDDDEAARRTEERILASPEALHHLIVVHTTGYQRWIIRAGVHLRWGFDLLLFATGVIPMVAISTWMVTAQVRGMLAVPLLWPLIAVGAAVTGIALWKVAQCFAGRAHSIAELHRGLGTLFFLGVAAPVLGLTGFVIHLYGIAMEVMRSRGSSEAVYAAAHPLAQGATLMGMGLLLGIGAGLVWFVLVGRIAAVERGESAALLAA